jgi:hypothetical protein
MTIHHPILVAGDYRDGVWKCDCGAKVWIVAIRYADFKLTVESLDLVSDCGARWRNHQVPRDAEIVSTP